MCNLFFAKAYCHIARFDVRRAVGVKQLHNIVGNLYIGANFSLQQVGGELECYSVCASAEIHCVVVAIWHAYLLRGCLHAQCGVQGYVGNAQLFYFCGKVFLLSPQRKVHGAYSDKCAVYRCLQNSVVVSKIAQQRGKVHLRQLQILNFVYNPSNFPDNCVQCGVARLKRYCFALLRKFKGGFHAVYLQENFAVGKHYVGVCQRYAIFKNVGDCAYVARSVNENVACNAKIFPVDVCHGVNFRTVSLRLQQRNYRRGKLFCHLRYVGVVVGVSYLRKLVLAWLQRCGNVRQLHRYAVKHPTFGI